METVKAMIDVLKLQVCPWSMYSYRHLTCRLATNLASVRLPCSSCVRACMPACIHQPGTVLPTQGDNAFQCMDRLSTELGSMADILAKQMADAVELKSPNLLETIPIM